MDPADVARSYWDDHHEVSEDPDFWMALPQCRGAINRRISGDPNLWPLEWFAREFGRPPFRRALSLGCGMGGLERAARRLGLCREIEGIDFSEASLELARARAREEGIEGISYRAGDLNDLELPRNAYDTVLIHQALHHVASVEKLLSRVALALTPDGLLLIEEWTGPSRTEWSDEEIALARALFAELPAPWRAQPVLQKPIALADPSETVRSSAILPRLRLLFDVVAERPYGGHLVALLLPQLSRPAIPEREFEALIGRLLELEELDLARRRPRSYHTFAVARPKRGAAALASRGAILAIRIGLAMRYRVPAALGRVASRGR